MSIEELLKGVEEIIKTEMYNKNRVASGNTIRELEINMITENRGQLLVPSHFKYIEKGSSPGIRGTWFYNKIIDWVKDKKITSDEKEAKKIGGAIANKIITSGTNAYRLGGEDVFSAQIEKYINENLDSLLYTYINNIKL